MNDNPYLVPAKPAPAWRLLPRYSAGVRTRLVFGGLLTIAGTVAGLSQPLIARLILVSIADHRSTVGPLAMLATAVVTGALALAVGYYLIEYAGETVVLGLRLRLADRILRLRISSLDEIPPGALMARLTADTTLLRQIATQGLVAATTSAISLFGTLALMAWLDGFLLMVTIGCVGVTVVAVRWSAARIGRATGRAQAALAWMATLLDRDLGAIRTVKAAGAEPAEIAGLATAARSAWASGLGLARWQAASGTAAVLSMQVAFLTVLGFGGARVADGSMPVSTLIAFMLFMLYLSQPISALATAYGQYRSGSVAAERIEQVMALPAEPAGGTAEPGDLASAGGFRRPDRRCATVTFEDAVFGYPNGIPVHRGLSFTVAPGGVTAVVGPSGAGKSTVFALIERFFDAQSGRVLIDGRDVREWPLEQLRAGIGYVEQDAPAIAGTLRENLTLGLGEVDPERIAEVLRTARLEAFVEQLPGGLDGEIGYRGGTLSGGERQRLAIARALLRSPRLLLLDEVTSQLDAANEEALRASIAAAADSTTVIVVAHRLSTVVGARQIVVLEAGRVRATGTHTELLASDILYRQLATTQLVSAPTAAVAEPERTTTHVNS